MMHAYEGYTAWIPLRSITANPAFCEQNPALRHDLSFEMGQMNSDVGLHFGDAPHDPVLKQEMLFRRKAEMHPTRAADRGFHTAPMMQLPALQRGRASTAPE